MAGSRSDSASPCVGSDSDSMKTMSKKRFWLVAIGLLGALESAAAPARSLNHRVWLLDGVPDETTVTAMRGAGVAGVVLPVGRVEVSEGGSRFTLAPVPDLKVMAGLPVTGLVWVEGRDRATGDPAVFAAQFAPMARSLPGGGGLILAARHYFPGLPVFATGVARRLQAPVELALGAGDLRLHFPDGGWPGVRPLAVVFGNPAALSFAPSTLQDDAALLDRLDAAPGQYRAAIVVVPGRFRHQGLRVHPWRLWRAARRRATTRAIRVMSSSFAGRWTGAE